MMHQLSASLFVFRLNRILDRRTRGAPFIAAGGEETEGCSSGIRADNLVFPGINWCSRLVNGRKGEKRVVETERRVPARNWSGSRGSSSDFTGPSLSLSLSRAEGGGIEWRFRSRGVAGLEAGQMDVWRGPRSSARVVREDSN